MTTSASGTLFSAFGKVFSMEIYNVQLKIFGCSADEKGRVFLRRVPQMCVAAVLACKIGLEQAL